MVSILSVTVLSISSYADGRRSCGRVSDRAADRDRQVEVIVTGNDIWVGFKAVIMSGVTIGDELVVGTRGDEIHSKIINSF